MKEAKYLRLRAGECARAATQTADPWLGRKLRELAAAYFGLAETAERTGSVSGAQLPYTPA